MTDHSCARRLRGLLLCGAAVILPLSAAQAQQVAQMIEMTVTGERPIAESEAAALATQKNSLSLVGPQAEKSLRNFNVDKAFLGVDGFDTKNGIYTPNVEEARLNEIMIEISKEVILLADSSKFSKRSFAFICPIDDIDKVITDSGIKPDDKKRLQDAGVEVIIV